MRAWLKSVKPGVRRCVVPVLPRLGGRRLVSRRRVRFRRRLAGGFRGVLCCGRRYARRVLHAVPHRFCRSCFGQRAESADGHQRDEQRVHGLADHGMSSFPEFPRNSILGRRNHSAPTASVQRSGRFRSSRDLPLGISSSRRLISIIRSANSTLCRRTREPECIERPDPSDARLRRRLET